MRRLEDRTSGYAEYLRLLKAEKLAECIREHYGPVNQALIDALPTQSAAWWTSLALAADVHPASPATVEAVIGLLSQNRKHDHPDDVLEGLPTP